MSLWQYFRLRDAAQAAARVDGDARRDAADELERSASRAEVAETLWATGLCRDALAAAMDGLRAAVAAAERAAPEDATQLAPALHAAGLKAPEQRSVAAALAACQIPLPAEDAELEPLHGDLFDAAQEASRAVRRRLEIRLLDPAGVTALRKLRVQLTLAVFAGALALVGMRVAFPPASIEATASAYRVNNVVETWPPENVVDRDATSYWHLPPGEGGWIELTLSPPRRVSALRIMNSHDAHVRDPNRADRRPFNQASHEIRVHAFVGAERVAEVDASLETHDDWSRVTVPLGDTHDGVDRIRIEVRSYHGDGGGLAEVEVLE